MARIFLSHSSANNAEAIALRDWLIREGWDDLFLDLDPQRGIVAGERWERALSEAANRCGAVLFLISRAWLDSRWCRRELHLALKLNKRVFGILIEDLRTADLPAELTETWQLVNLAAGADHLMFRCALPTGREVHVTFSKAALLKLKAGLTKAGLDARFFAWPPEGDPDRLPYRGLRPLEAEDAGIFFGREDRTVAALDQLRGISTSAPPRLLVVLGASGAGKSSFLRAGLVPRLQRDDRHFLPLPIVRPERAALTGETGFVRCLHGALLAGELRRTLVEVRTAVQRGASAVRGLLDELTDRVRPSASDDTDRPLPPRLVLSIDQGEELFLAEGAEEARAFLGLVRDLAVEAASNLIVLITIRSDALEYLQAAPQLEGIPLHTFSLEPLPKGVYQVVIEGPAARLRETRRALRIEPALTAALLADVESGGGKDALPLLAFTLERLYREQGGDGDLTEAEYRAIGGIRGSIEAAVERALAAADRDPAVPKERAARLALLRRALIPWLAGIDPETGSPRRRVARFAEIPAEARPLVEHLIAARLLTTDFSMATQERTIEPAHEVLLRQWGLLQGWLEEDLGPLATLEGLKRATRDWEANGGHVDWLAHTASRLKEAEALLEREDLARFLDTADRAYLDACRTADTARRAREREEARKLAWIRLSTGQDPVGWSRTARREYPDLRAQVLDDAVACPEAEVRANAAAILWQDPDDDTAQRLVDLIVADPSESVRRIAARGLLALNRPELFGSLLVDRFTEQDGQPSPGQLRALALLRSLADVRESMEPFDRLYQALPRAVRARARLAAWGTRFREGFPVLPSLFAAAGLSAAMIAGPFKMVPAGQGWALAQDLPRAGTGLFHGVVAGVLWGGLIPVGLMLYRIVFWTIGRRGDSAFLPIGSLVAGLLAGLLSSILITFAIIAVYSMDSLQKMGWVGSLVTEEQRWSAAFWHDLLIVTRLGFGELILGTMLGLGMALTVNAVRASRGWHEIVAIEAPVSTPRDAGRLVGRLFVMVLRHSWLLALTQTVATVVVWAIARPSETVIDDNAHVFRETLGDAATQVVGAVAAIAGMCLAILVMRRGVRVAPRTEAV